MASLSFLKWRQTFKIGQPNNHTMLNQAKPFDRYSTYNCRPSRVHGKILASYSNQNLHVRSATQPSKVLVVPQYDVKCESAPMPYLDESELLHSTKDPLATSSDNEWGSESMNTEPSSDSVSNDSLADALLIMEGAVTRAAILKTPHHPTPPWRVPIPLELQIIDQMKTSDNSIHESADTLVNTDYAVGPDESANYYKNWTTVGDKPLGEGAFGVVTLAVRKCSSRTYKPSDKGKLYAVKRSKLHCSFDKGSHSLYKERMMHEVAKFGDSWKSQELFALMVDYERNATHPSWLAYEYIHGPTVQQLSRVLNFAPASLVLDVMEDLLDGLEWLHDTNGLKPFMAHRDLHCSNLMFDLSRPTPPGRNPHIRILDLGLATFAASTDPESKFTSVYHGQQEDVNSFGHIIHALSHFDWRGLGRGRWTETDQVSHCHDLEDRHNYCPGRTDPGSPLFRVGTDAYYRFIVDNCFKRWDRAACAVGSWSIVEIKRYLRPYIDQERFQEMARPFYEEQLDDTWKAMRNYAGAVPELPLEHRSSPFLPALSTVPAPAPGMFALPSLCKQALPCTCIHTPPCSCIPPVPPVPARQWPPLSTKFTKRTQEQMDLEDNPGVDEPLAKRMRIIAQA